MSSAAVSGSPARFKPLELTAPAKMPAAPIPAIARPMMKAMELGAAPQMAEAASKVRTLRKRVYRTEKKVKSLPNNNCSAQQLSI